MLAVHLRVPREDLRRVPDGCGGTLECGGCPTGQSCGGGGTPNVCAAVVTCQPPSCEALGKTCGEIPDGCGGSLWSAKLPTDGACSVGPGVTAVDHGADGAVLVDGEIWRPIALGSDRLVPDGGDGFAVLLAP